MAPQDAAHLGAYLPQELLDLFIDEIGSYAESEPELRLALTSCALVSHSFHARTSKHLFSHILISREADPCTHTATAQRLESLAQLMHANKGIASNIRGFAIDTWFKPSSPSFEHRLIFGNPNLQWILANMPSIREFAWSNHHAMLSWSSFSDTISSAIHDICAAPSLRSLDLQCIAGLPSAMLNESKNLKHLCLVHVEPAPLPLITDDSLLSPTSRRSHDEDTDGGIRLHKVVDYDASSMLFTIQRSTASSSSIFSRLREFHVWMRHDSEVAAAWTIMQQAAETLELLDIPELTHFRYLVPPDPTLIPGPIDIGILRALCTIKMRCRIASLDRVTFPMGVCGLLKPSTTPSPISAVDITFDWIDCTPGTEDARFLEQPGWGALDDVLSDSSTFPLLKTVSITLRQGYGWDKTLDGHPPAHIVRIKRRTESLARSILPRTSALPRAQVYINVLLYNSVYALKYSS